MKLQYLGTAAAEGIPALFCTCETCRQARLNGGRDCRTRSQAIIDGKILIDWNADALSHFNRFGIDATMLRTVLISHVHGDHFYPEDFAMRRRGYAEIDGIGKLTVYGSPDIAEPLSDPKIHIDSPDYGVNTQVVLPFEPFEVEGYRITALKANHGTEHPYLYMIEKYGKALLYAHDTGLFPDETWDYLARCGVRLDLVSLDCTAGNKAIDYSSHMNLARNRAVCNRLREIGAIDDETVLVVNHFSHNGGDVVYDKMVTLAAADGFRVSFDGMTVEI